MIEGSPRLISINVTMDKIQLKNYNAEEFLQAISHNGELYSLLNGRYVFRGHSSEKWDLIPTALREKAFDRVYFDDEHRITSKISSDAPDWECLQIEREIGILRNFYEKCDKYGLAIPEIPRLRKDIFNALASNLINQYEDWISEDFYELAALAQHYGLPTRLLDWSYSVFVALYFAISGIRTINDSELTPGIVIWALDTRLTDPVYHKGTPLKIIRPKYDGNLNLCAQKGLFTFWLVKKGENPQTSKGNINSTNRQPLDKLITENLEVDDMPLMYKIVICRENLSELYDFLKYNHIEAATLFPGYSGVTRSIIENQFFSNIHKQR